MANEKPKIIITIDVERDYDSKWQIPSNLSYRGVTEAIPKILTPLFNRFDIHPTYFLGAEVIGKVECVETLSKIHNCEFATHLHSEYVPPKRTKFDISSPDLHIEEMQCEYVEKIEQEKLSTLTELFIQQFGYSPRSFRAGRFGISHSTGKILMELGYHVDSSVTPHIEWTTRTGRKFPDFRRCCQQPYFVSSNGDIWKNGRSKLLEVPVTIIKNKQTIWFRPWYSDSKTLKHIIDTVFFESKQHQLNRPLVMMFHNVELIPGASPYPQTENEIALYLEMLTDAISYAKELGFESCTLDQFYQNRISLKDDKLQRKNSVISLENSFDRNLSVEPEFVYKALEKNNVQPWFKYIFNERETRWDVWRSSQWIAENISPTNYVLETGCGVGFNLLWLAELGYNYLFGFDIDPKAIRAGIEIADHNNLPLSLWVDDGVSPNFLPNRKFSCIVALNWTFLLENYYLDDFIKTYIPFLDENGVFIFDIIDASYNQVKNNQYLSSDIERPISERKTSEYKFRMSEDDVKHVLLNFGLHIIDIITEEQKIPKIIYIASFSSKDEINNANIIKVIPRKGYHSKIRSINNYIEITKKVIKNVFLK